MGGTPTETGGEGLQREVAIAAGVQGVKDVLQLLGRQGQLSVEPLPGGGGQNSVNHQCSLTGGPLTATQRPVFMPLIKK